MTITDAGARSARRIFLAAVTVLLVAGCTAAGPPLASVHVAAPTPTSGPSDDRSAAPSAAPSIDVTTLDEDTLTAIRIRTSYGLPADLDTIRRAAADPAATTEFGTPLFPAETAELFARNERTQPIVAIAQAYIRDHASVSGGLWIDQAAGGVVTLSFTDDLDQHRRALAGLLAGRGVVAVVPARYSEASLRAFQDRVAADDAWFTSIGAALQGVGYAAIENVLSIGVSSANPNVKQLVLARYGLPADAVGVTSDGTGAAMLPVGTVRGRVLTAAGKPPGNRELMVDGRGGDPGWCGGGDIGYGVMPDGRFEIPCKVGHRTIVVLDLDTRDKNGLPTVIGHADVVVPADGLVRVTIHLDPPV